VSAVMASPAASGSAGSVPADPVRALQHALYRAAKADPGRRFHALMDKVTRSDVLWRGWVAVRGNNGAPDIDKVTLAQVEEHGVARLLDELASELREKRYRPMPARRVLIPKPGSDEMRPLSIPAVRDRIVQAALKIVLEPVFEAGFLPCSFGVWDAAGCLEEVPGGLGFCAVEDQERGGEQGRPSDAEAAVGDDVGAAAELAGQVLEGREDGGQVGDGAVGDGDGGEAEAGLPGSLRLAIEAGLAEFAWGEGADQDVNVCGLQGGHLVG
jgi:hypothetical protein